MDGVFSLTAFLCGPQRPTVRAVAILHFMPVLEQGFELILVQEDIGSIGNNFIASVPRHPMIAAALNHVVNLVLGHQGDNIWFLTGPGALTHLFGQFYLDDLKRMQLPRGVRVWSIYQLHRFVRPHIPLNYKQDDRHWISPKNSHRPLFRQSSRSV
jgi:hypothetical protein